MAGLVSTIYKQLANQPLKMCFLIDRPQLLLLSSNIYSFSYYFNCCDKEIRASLLRV